MTPAAFQIEQTSAAVRAWRTRMGWDRTQAAEGLGVAFDTYKSFENNQRALPLYIAKLAGFIERSAQGQGPQTVLGSPIHVVGGGTFSRVRHHFSLAAEAFGTTTDEIAAACARHGQPATVHLTRMADRASDMVTSEDVGRLLDRLVADSSVKIVFMNAALCDFDGQIGDVPSGKYASRLKSREGETLMRLTPAEKMIGKLRATRKDLFAVGFKTTAGATPEEQFRQALHLVKANSLNLVLANDPVTRLNMVVAPEEAWYHRTTDRAQALEGLVEMALMRSTNTFTRSTVVPGESVRWEDPIIPQNLREVVDHCIDRGAYKPFRGVTAGHFAVRAGEGRIITSKRKHDFNRLREEGMVLVEYEGDDQVIAHGFKPSVGGQSQRVVFSEHDDADCIVHFHSPMRSGALAAIPHKDQRPNECGSHECGRATSQGLREVAPGIKAVMLDEHGPNVVFSKHTPADRVIAFIEANFDLSAKTGGPVA